MEERPPELAWEDLRQLKKGDVRYIDPMGRVTIDEVFTHAYNRLVVKVIQSDGQVRILKAFRFKNVPKSMMTMEILQGIVGQITKYRQELEEVGITLAEDFGFTTKITSSGEPIMHQWEDYAGKTSSGLIQNSDQYKATVIVQAILDQIVAPLFNNAPNAYNPGYTNLGLDLSDRNITVSSGLEIDQPKMVYVDLFPYKRWPSGARTPTLEFPEPTDPMVVHLGMFRHYNMAGLLINFWSNLCRIRPEMAEVFFNQIKNFLRDNGYDSVAADIVDFLNTGLSPVLTELDGKFLKTGAFSKEHIFELIRSWEFPEVFKFRLLACVLAHHRPESTYLLADVFDKSHFQSVHLDITVICKIRNTIMAMAEYPVKNNLAN